MESTGMGEERKDTVRRQENNKEVRDKRKGVGNASIKRDIETIHTTVTF